MSAALDTGLPEAPAQALPLSFAQQRMWFLQQLAPGDPYYGIPMPLRLTGPLDAAALERALAEVVRRHEALRTVFRTIDGEPVQVVLPAGGFHLPVEDLAPLPPPEREALTRRLAEADEARPFDLATGPLFRARLLRLGDEDHVLLLAMHHVVGDGWSLGVLFRELAALYSAFSRGLPSPLPELPIQYADFAVWQRERLAGGEMDRLLGYWKHRLQGLAPLELPTDRPRPAAPSHQGRVHTFSLSPSLAEPLREIGRAEGATLFMVLLAGFKALLARYGGVDDVAVGSPVANRTLPELEGLIGFFVNTLVLRTDLSGEPGFRELVRRVRETTLEAYDHQELPFERLVEELHPERDPARTPLFQVMLVFLNTPEEDVEIPGLRMRSEPGTRARAGFDLTLTAWSTPDGGCAATLEYATDLFDTGTVEALADHYVRLLQAAAAAPDRPVAELDVLSAAERERLLVEWNATAAPFPRGAVLPRLFEAQARRTPDAAAVVFDGGEWTYRSLDRRADALARRLDALGVGPGRTVGLALERSPELCAAILAVLKAGAACVPLDPAYPPERLRHMLADSGAAVLLARAGAGEELSGGVPTLVVGELDEEAEAPPPRRVHPEDLAYVVYTSGSTGTPKGIAMPHRPLVNLVAWQVGRWGGTGAPTLQFASPSFDVSFQEMFSTWTSGGALVLAGDAERSDPARLLELLRRRGVRRCFLPFVALRELAAAIAAGEGAGELEEVCTAGEQLRVDPVLRTAFERAGCALENQYGPSEAHVVSSHRLPGPPAGWEALPPIGRPIANAKLYVLDGRLRPLPRGVPGELYVGGECLARGYLGRPALTAERFVPDPFGAGGRLYRTGDHARHRADGSLEFLGRRDGQVKVRGYRVEVGEIEAVLAAHPTVRECAAAARPGPGGDAALVAYVVLAEGPAPLAAADLREHLAGRLPVYMVPRTFVVLDALPLTPSGKVDRARLPAPAVERAGGGGPPRNSAEQAVAAVWAEVLGVPGVEVDDDFFALGGHSLLGMRVVTRLRARHGVGLPVSTLFEAPTLAAFAARFQAADEAEAARLLDELEGLDDDAVAALLAAEENRHRAEDA